MFSVEEMEGARAITDLFRHAVDGTAFPQLERLSAKPI